MVNRRKTAAEIRSIRESGRMLATVLQFLRTSLEPGITTAELDRLAAEELQKLGGEPAFLGYGGFPAVLCTSVNDEAQHGIPGSRVLELGDIVNLDFGVRYQGMVTDGGITVGVGEVNSDVQKLLTTTEQALADGIGQVKDGARTGDIASAVGRRLRGAGLGIIEELCGHGVGHHLHEDPPIFNEGKAGTGSLLKAGMTIAIEPMATLGSDHVELDEDGWLWRTVDGSWSAQFEHTVLVTETGAEILTKL
jgi:methionyl aminopeptidase